MKKKLFVLFALVILILLGSYLLFSRQYAIKDIDVVKVGYLPIGAALPLFVAEENGHFKKNDLIVEFVEFKSSNDVAAAAKAKRIDFVGSGATNAMLDANSETDAGLVLFSVNNYLKRPNLQSTDFVFVNKNSEIQSFKDLNGKTVAIFPGSVGEVFSKAIMPKLGVDINDIKKVPMAPTQWIASLKTGSVDSVVGAVEPFATIMINSGDFRVIHDGYYGELSPKVPASGAWFIDGHLEEEVEVKIVNAISSAISDIESDPLASKIILTKYTSIQKDIASEIRLQDWEMINEAGVKDSAKALALTFYDLGGIQENPKNDDWLWTAP